MGLTCKPFGKMKSVFKKLENQIAEDKKSLKPEKRELRSKRERRDEDRS